MVVRYTTIPHNMYNFALKHESGTCGITKILLRYDTINKQVLENNLVL